MEAGTFYSINAYIACTAPSLNRTKSNLFELNHDLIPRACRKVGQEEGGFHSTIHESRSARETNHNHQLDPYH